MASRANEIDLAQPSQLLRGVALFHKLEIAYVLVMFAMVAWGILQASAHITLFLVVWFILCIAAGVVALWPGVPRGLTIYAEGVLLVVAMGLIIAPRHGWLPWLSRKVRYEQFWSDLPLTERRLLTWNIIAALSLAWLIVPYAYFVNTRKSQDPLYARILICLTIWTGLGGVLYLTAVSVLW